DPDAQPADDGWTGTDGQETSHVADTTGPTTKDAKAELKSVTFSGTGFKTVYADTGTQAAFTGPHWTAAKHAPVSFVRNPPKKVQARLTVTGTANKLPVRGAGTDNRNIPATAGTVSGPTVTSGIVSATKAFPDMITYFDPFTVSWEVSGDGGTTWVAAGKS